MSRGLGSTQRAVLDIVNANPDGLPADAIAAHVHGSNPTAAQFEAVRRAIRTLHSRGLVQKKSQWERRPRRSLKRLIDLTPCEGEFCASCAQRKRRVRLDDWHRRNMRASAKHDPAWLTDLAVAEASGFVHATASAERVVDTKPATVDQCFRRVQFVLPLAPNS